MGRLATEPDFMTMCVPLSLLPALQSQTPPLLEGQPLEGTDNPTGTSQTSLDGLEIGGENTVVVRSMLSHRNLSIVATLLGSHLSTAASPY